LCSEGLHAAACNLHGGFRSGADLDMSIAAILTPNIVIG
jgi:hypothetical protein